MAAAAFPASGGATCAKIMGVLPLGLRECVLSWSERGLDLVPWIDPFAQVPDSPIVRLVAKFLTETHDATIRADSYLTRILAQGDFFDGHDLKEPAIQHCVWRMIRQGYAVRTIENALCYLNKVAQHLDLKQAKPDGLSLADL